MFQSYVQIGFLVVLAAAVASAGLIETHHVVEPVVAKVGAVVHSAPSAVSHQSFTRFHNKAVIAPVVAPVVKTTYHAAPAVVHHAAPAVVHHTYAAAPVVHSVPIVHTAPVVKTIVPAAYTVHH